MATDSALTRLIYASRRSKPEERETRETVRDIVAASILRNKDAEITGLLLYRHGWFLQVLEGATEKVDETFDRIRRDLRHHDVRVVEDDLVAERSFADWNMAATPLDQLPDGMLGRLGLDGHFDPILLTADKALALLVAAAEAERDSDRARMSATRSA